MLSSSAAPYVAVMDADLQHDETMLTAMLATLKRGNTDLVAASRYIEGGSAANSSTSRAANQRLRHDAHAQCARCRSQDPMSGFFMMRRECSMRSRGSLLRPDSSSCSISSRPPDPLAHRRTILCLRQARAGRSKFNVQIGLEFLGLLLAKLTGDLVNPRFIFFALVGAIGLGVHLIVLKLALAPALRAFRAAQSVATFVAMTSNFLLNNELTYRDRRLKGLAHVARLSRLLRRLLGRRPDQCRPRRLALCRAAGVVGRGRGRRGYGRVVELRALQPLCMAHAMRPLRRCVGRPVR